MAYASVTYTSASGTTFALTNSSGDPIPYLRQADIAVTVNGTLKTQGTDYTFNSAGTAIVFSVAVSGATVVINRTTDISDATVVYTAGSTLTAQDLNNADNQIRYGLQEFSDTYGALTTGSGDLSALAGFIGSAETWLSDNAHAPTTGAVDSRVDSKIDTALTTDVVAGDSLTITDNSPASGQITIGVTNASISTAKLVDSSVTTAKIADGNVTTAKILDSNVTTAKIADSNVTTAKIADSAVTSAKIADGTIVASDLASDAVTTAKILDANVTTGKIADGAVTTGKLADSSVTSGKIADGTIVAGDLASDSVTTAKILDANVTTAKIADSNVTTGKIADSAVTAVKIADGVITSAKLNASTVVTNAEQSASTPDDTSFFTTSASDARYDARYVNVTGDTMSGALAMGSNKITGLGTPTANADAATKLYVDNSVAAGVGDADYGDITVSGTGTVWTIDSGVVTSAKIADGTIVDGDISATAEIAVSKLADGAARQLLQTDVAGTGVEWTSNIDIPGTLDVTGAAVFDSTISATGTSTAASFIPTSSTAPSNGVYLPSANNVAISTNGTGRLFINSSGQVGVGTASPSSALHVKGIIRAHRSDDNNPRYAQISFEGGTCSLDSVRNDSQFESIVFRQSADNGSTYTERMRLDSSGRLGVGTSSVVSKFQISNSGAEGYEFNPGDAANVNATFHYNRASSAWVANRTGASYHRFDVSGSEAMRLTSTGLGLGTSSPSVRLHSADSNGDVLRLERTGAFFGSWGVKIGQSSTGDFTLRDETNNINVVTIPLNTGRVGIGTALPSEALTVGSGNVQITGGQLAIGSLGSSGLQFINNGTIGTVDSIPLILRTAATERARIDTSGRLLVGTSTAPSAGSWNQYAKIVNLGTTNNASGAGVLSLNRGTATSSIVAGNALGVISFGDSSGNEFALIECEADATAGSSDYPGRLKFSTTADGASSPTERVRIANNGNFYIGGGTSFGASGWTTQNAGCQVSQYSPTSDTRTLYQWQSDNAGTNTTAVYIESTGKIYARTTTVQAIASERRLKENIAPVDQTESWSTVRDLPYYKYNFIGSDPTNVVYGPIADEVPDEMRVATSQSDDVGVIHTYDNAMLQARSFVALQAALKRIEALEAEVAALKGE